MHALPPSPTPDPTHLLSNRRLAHMGAKGWGLLAGAPVAEDALVCEYVGEVVGVAEATRRANAYARAGVTHTYIMSLQCAPAHLHDALSFLLFLHPVKK